MLSIGITDGKNESLSAAASRLLSILLHMHVAQHSADQLRLERWTAERIHHADAHSGLWFQLLPHADRPLHWKQGGRGEGGQKTQSSALCCVVLPGCQSRFLFSSIRVYRKRSLGGRKAGLCVCFRGFWHFVINVESICFHKPVSGVSVSPFLVCLSNVVGRLRRLKKKQKNTHSRKTFFFFPSLFTRRNMKRKHHSSSISCFSSWCYVTSASLSVFCSFVC